MYSQRNKPHASSCLASAEATWTDGLFFGAYMAAGMMLCGSRRVA
jgi:hypothetical protein